MDRFLWVNMADAERIALTLASLTGLLGCINKTSDAELSEAINSMCRWYREANYCVAYLADANYYRGSWEKREWQQSEWFRRGWTLQELLAPKCVLLVDHDWKVIGHKCPNEVEGTSECFGCNQSYANLNKAISNITGIPEGVLYDFNVCKEVPFTVRMQWTNGRRTTRQEDMAYCLLGIFNVYMPLIYWEGSLSSQDRLIEEVAKRAERLRNPQALALRSSFHAHFARMSIIPDMLELGTLRVIIDEVSIPAAQERPLCCITRLGTQLQKASRFRSDPQQLRTADADTDSNGPWEVIFTLKAPLEHHNLKLLVCKHNWKTREVDTPVTRPVENTSQWSFPSRSRALDRVGEASINLASKVGLDDSLPGPKRSQHTYYLVLADQGHDIGTMRVTLIFVNAAGKAMYRLEIQTHSAEEANREQVGDSQAVGQSHSSSTFIELPPALPPNQQT